MAKICISSDWHLDWNTAFDRPTDQGIGSRLQEIIDSALWVADLGKKNKCSMFVGCGDHFNKASTLPTKEGLAILDMFKKISSKFDKTLMLVGNHDMQSENHNILDLFSETTNLKVMSKPSIVDIEGARLFFLPYVREPEDFYAAVEKFYAADCNSKKYLFCHMWDTSIFANDGGAIDLSKINMDFFDRVFSGHFHIPTDDLNSKMIYIGTLLNKKFSETGPKGALILDISKNKLTFHKNPFSPEFYTVFNEASLLSLEPGQLETNAYYKVSCNPENVVELSKRLLSTKGFEIVGKVKEGEQSKNINLDGVSKKNSLTLKEYILSNCSAFLPAGVSLEDFKSKGEELLKGM